MRLSPTALWDFLPREGASAGGHRLLLLLMALLLVWAPCSYASEPPVYLAPPNAFDLVPNLLEDLPSYFKHASISDHWRGYLGILAASGALIYYDQKLLDNSQKFAKQIHLINPDGEHERSRRVATTRIGGSVKISSRSFSVHSGWGLMATARPWP